MGIDCEDYMLKLNIYKVEPQVCNWFWLQLSLLQWYRQNLNIYLHYDAQLFKINDRIIQKSNSIMIFWSSSYVFEWHWGYLSCFYMKGRYLTSLLLLETSIHRVLYDQMECLDSKIWKFGFDFEWLKFKYFVWIVLKD